MNEGGDFIECTGCQKFCRIHGKKCLANEMGLCRYCGIHVSEFEFMCDKCLNATGRGYEYGKRSTHISVTPTELNIRRPNTGTIYPMLSEEYETRRPLQSVISQTGGAVHVVKKSGILTKSIRIFVHSVVTNKKVAFLITTSLTALAGLATCVVTGECHFQRNGGRNYTEDGYFCAYWRADKFGLDMPKFLASVNMTWSIHGAWLLEEHAVATSESCLTYDSFSKLFQSETGIGHFVDATQDHHHHCCGSQYHEYIKHGCHQGIGYDDWIGRIKHCEVSFSPSLCLQHQCRYNHRAKCNVVQSCTMGKQLPDVGCKAHTELCIV